MDEAARIAFFAKIRVNKLSGCWEWTGSKMQKGYGLFGVSCKTRRAHRISYEIHLGPIPSGMCVCHRCDNRSCVNPKHLFLGEPATNSADMVAKGRSSRGVKHAFAKLTEPDVLVIRAARGRVLQRDLAAQYGISQANISLIQLGRGWTHLKETAECTE